MVAIMRSKIRTIDEVAYQLWKERLYGLKQEEDPSKPLEIPFKSLEIVDIYPKDERNLGTLRNLVLYMPKNFMLLETSGVQYFLMIPNPEKMESEVIHDVCFSKRYTGASAIYSYDQEKIAIPLEAKVTIADKSSFKKKDKELYGAFLKCLKSKGMTFFTGIHETEERRPFISKNKILGLDPAESGSSSDDRW